ncbi:unnamed protein product [marine sediment metagenome]|uniref:Uncharacterized protein n=1 Tax=marine sediment metagenome TaxID=412755 RepID=X1K395_9ZZZZ
MSNKEDEIVFLGVVVIPLSPTMDSILIFITYLEILKIIKIKI